jgi:hypothetical protein
MNRDCTRCPRPIFAYQVARQASRGLIRMASSASGMASATEPVQSLPSLRKPYRCGQVGLIARAVSNTGIASACRLLRAQHLPLRGMRASAARRCRHGLRSQLCATREVCRRRICQFIDHAACERICQPALRLGRLWIDRQCTIKKADRLVVIISVKRHLSSPSPQDVVERIGTLGRP